MRHLIAQYPIQLKSGVSRQVSLFDTGLSRCVAREVLNGIAYPLLPEDVLPAESVKTIYDVGANVGVSCIYWCDSYPNAKVYAYEPCEAAYALLCENTATLQVEPYNVALGAEDGLVDLFYNVEDDVCNSLKNHKSYGHEKVVIERARHHINGPIDVLKIDTEGCESEIIADVCAWMDGVKVLYLEYHSENKRLRIDAEVKHTHTLWSASSTRPHRGELCYLRSDLVPENYSDWAI